MAFLDSYPVNYRHSLLIPRDHYKNMEDTPLGVIRDIFERVHDLPVVGIEVLHFHIHLLPCFCGDELKDFWPRKEYKEDMERTMGEAIRRIRDER